MEVAYISPLETRTARTFFRTLAILLSATRAYELATGLQLWGTIVGLLAVMGSIVIAAALTRLASQLWPEID